MRITVKHLQAKIDIVNGYLGYNDADMIQYNTVGAVRLSGAYGGHGVHRVVNTSGGVDDLMGGHLSAREASQFLSGMIAALRITNER